MNSAAFGPTGPGRDGHDDRRDRADDRGDLTGRAPDPVREELALLLPAPAERDLPPGRHLHHKERLMKLIDDDPSASSESREPAAVPTPSEAPAPRRRPWRPALWLPAASLALAGALTAGLVTTGSSGGPGSGRPETGNAVVLLDRIADVAAQTPAAPVRDDQLVYVKSLTAGAEGQEDGSFKPGRLHAREAWMSQRPGPVKQLGLFYEGGDYLPFRELLPPGSPGVRAGIDRPTYHWLASLPTDPDDLLKELYRLTRHREDEDRAQTVFDKIGELIGATVMPPENAAALYRAAARIPGVHRVKDAADPAGRHGVAIVRVDEKESTATEWIFDRQGLSYLGERSYLTRDCQAGKKGTTMSEEAVLKRAVVDAYRDRPGSATS